MDGALIGSALLRGVAGMPHCAAMCSAPCAAVAGPRGAGAWAFQGARVAGYAVAGFVASASVGSLAALAQWTPALRPLWVLFHVAMLTLGLWLLVQGRQPAWMGQIGRAGVAGPSGAPLLAAGAAPVRVWRRPARAALAGGLGVAWPCGLLQSALLVASMTQSAWAGAAAMGGFAMASAGGLLAAPALWRLLRGRADAPAFERRLARAAGALLAVAALFALGHDVWPPIAAWCGLG
ncbi:MAG: sulfite exporter TauE/SafE family protein [Betaproteobacteria bacterium]